MDTLNLRVAYRPVRVGWCVRYGNMDEIAKCIRQSCTLWGGRYNPLIPVGGDTDSDAIIQQLGVDILYPASAAPELATFINSFSYLKWWGMDTLTSEFFVETGSGLRPPFLDVTHPIQEIYNEYVKDKQSPQVKATLFAWDPADPLAYAFLAQFGDYPAQSVSGVDFARVNANFLGSVTKRLGANEAVPSDAFREITPVTITQFGLSVTSGAHRDNGFYVGRADNFEDIVNLWNLRAAGLEIFFFDPQQEMRIAEMKNSLVAWIQRESGEPRHFPRPVGIWSREGTKIDSNSFGKYLSGQTVRACNVQLESHAGEVNERSVLAVVSQVGGRHLVSVQLPENPFSEDLTFSQQSFVIVIRQWSGFFSDPDVTLMTPFLPELNEFYRREMLVIGDGFRVQRRGFGIITMAVASEVSFYAPQISKIVAAVFEVFGIHAEPSSAGKIAKRLIHQMDGLHGCRVFKLRGVRKLIEAYGPLQSFTRGAATSLIAQLDAESKPNFPAIFIRGKQLTVTSAFDYLLEKGVFRVGLELTCSNCDLLFWLALESLKHEVICEYCGKSFNVTPQLKDRDWRYRRSGLFGKDNHQEGAIPVALTLQQLESNIRFLDSRLFATSFKLEPVSAKISSCETDLVSLSQDLSGRVQLVIGECKSGGIENEITEDDVRHLVTVANAFPPDRVRTYIVFSKTGSFTQDEVLRCRNAQNELGPRVILLSERELEPYFIYEKTSKEFAIRKMGSSLQNLADVTNQVFFDSPVENRR
jgi:hypothetical protein